MFEILLEYQQNKSKKNSIFLLQKENNFEK